jgi:hypothetical protein
MTGEEQAKTYAEGKVQEALSAVVEKAFADGYDAGYKNAMAELKVEPALEEDGIKFVDLGLPSGTLWASDYLKNKNGDYMLLNSYEASPLSLPTKEQIEELLSCCNVSLKTLTPSTNNNNLVYKLERNNKKLYLSPKSFWLKEYDSSNPNYHMGVSSLRVIRFPNTSSINVLLVKRTKW